MSLALLFGFTGIADSPLIFWTVGITSNVGALLIFLIKTHSSQAVLTSMSIQQNRHISLIASLSGLMVVAASFAQGRISPLTWNPTKWLPDDYPLFASWAEQLSNGSQGNLVIEGFTLKYHWLTYSFLGGLDRLFSNNFMSGPVLMAPVIAWVGLAFGAIAVTQLLSRNSIAPLLASTSVLFASTIGVMAYSTGGLGGITVSPSHLISASWVPAVMILFYTALLRSNTSYISTILFFALGFSLALAKFTSFVTVLFGTLAMLLIVNRRRLDSFVSKENIKLILLPLSFSVGASIAFLLHISGSETLIDIDQSLKFSSSAGLANYFLQMLPLGAYAFSIIVLILPSVLLVRNRVGKEPLVGAATTLSLSGFFVAVILQLRDSNEAWFISGSLAFILPVSAVLVSEKVQNTSTKFFRSYTIWVYIILVALILSLFLLWSRELESFQVRPWLTPALILGTSAFAWALYGVLSRKSSKESISATCLIRFVGYMLIATLFLTSIVFGIALRGQSFWNTSNSRDDISLSRDLWIQGAQELIDSGSLDPNNRALAIYSTSLGEQTLTRWIPMLAKERAYLIRSDDLVKNVFFSDQRNLMNEREAHIRQYVETGSISSCTALRNDGILQIWLTPNIDFNRESGAPNPSHRLIGVQCD
jgi:hypothetical protein